MRAVVRGHAGQDAHNGRFSGSERESRCSVRCVCAQASAGNRKIVGQQTEGVGLHLVVEKRVVAAGDVNAREARKELAVCGAACRAARGRHADASGAAALAQLGVAPDGQQRLQPVLGLVLQQMGAAAAHRTLAHCCGVCSPALPQNAGNRQSVQAKETNARTGATAAARHLKPTVSQCAAAADDNTHRHEAGTRLAKSRTKTAAEEGTTTRQDGQVC